MKKHASKNSEREYDFALVLDGVADLTTSVEDALFGAGCDDATFSLQHGRLYAEFSRKAKSLKDAILSAIRDVRNAKIGAAVLRVDDCDLVTQSDVARRIGRSRQLVHQYLTGRRGPGGFPPPVGHLAEGMPLWQWCDVSSWLARHDIIRPEEGQNAEVVAAVNNALEGARQRQRHPDLVKEIVEAVHAGPCLAVDTPSAG